MTSKIVSQKRINIAGASIAQDQEGRYSLNDLHKAAGGEGRFQPSNWLRMDATKELCNEIDRSSDMSIAQNLSEAQKCSSVVTIKGGKNQGTYVCKELVYAYAMWISAKFHLQVIRTFDAVANNRLEEFKAEQVRTHARQAARLDAPHMTDAIKHRREAQGKEVAHFHFSNEFDLVNRIALGKSAKEFRASHGIPKDGAIRDHLTALEINCVERLQSANTALIDLGFDFAQRKTELHKLYVLRHSIGLMAEVQRIEA